MNYTKLIKLLYLADRTALLDRIKGSGPEHAQSSWDKLFYTEGYDLNGEKTNRATETLSEIEEQILTDIDNRYKNTSYGEMIEVVHNPDVCPEWSDPGSGAVRITLDQILSAPPSIPFSKPLIFVHACTMRGEGHRQADRCAFL